jgi:hypothetical protein
MKIKLFTIVFLFATLLNLTGCKEDEEATPTPDVTLKANAGADQDILPNQAVTVDGSASTGSATKTFSWRLLSKPGLSTIALGQASDVKSTFTPDIVGYYELELTVTDGASKSIDHVKIKAEYPGPLTIDSEINTAKRLFDRILDPSKPDYIVTKDIPVKAELNIDRGVAIAFERDKTLSIEEKGSISALGVAEQRIRFTGTEAKKSFWAGIRLFSPSTANAFTFVDVEHGGSRVAFTNIKAGLAMFGNNQAQISISDSKFSNNDGFGMYVQNGSVLRNFARNSFNNQTEAGILIDAYNATLLDAASKFTGDNGRNAVEINSSDIRGTQDVSWSAFDDKTPYRLLGDMTVEAGWTLKAGVTVEIARDASIRINRGGYLLAKGTEGKLVTIKGVSSTAANWKGIIFYSISNLNVMEQTEISGAGSAVIVSGQRSAITAYGKGAKLNISKSRIVNSGGYGIMYTSDAELNADAAASNTFAGNAQANLFKL